MSTSSPVDPAVLDLVALDDLKDMLSDALGEIILNPAVKQPLPPAFA